LFSKERKTIYSCFEDPKEGRGRKGRRKKRRSKGGRNGRKEEGKRRRE